MSLRSYGPNSLPLGVKAFSDSATSRSCRLRSSYLRLERAREPCRATFSVYTGVNPAGPLCKSLMLWCGECGVLDVKPPTAGVPELSEDPELEPKSTESDGDAADWVRGSGVVGYLTRDR